MHFYQLIHLVKKLLYSFFSQNFKMKEWLLYCNLGENWKSDKDMNVKKMESPYLQQSLFFSAKEIRTFYDYHSKSSFILIDWRFCIFLAHINFEVYSTTLTISIGFTNVRNIYHQRCLITSKLYLTAARYSINNLKVIFSGPRLH